MRRIALFLVLIAYTSFAYSKAELNRAFADNMVLQQNAAVAIWGKTKPNAKIKIVAGWKSTYKTTADNDGRFTVDIKTPKAGGPYNITIDDGDILELKNILIGEVWIASGQSNMEMKVKGYDARQLTLNKEAIVKHASSNPEIRFLTLEKTLAETPQKNLNGNWQETNASTVLEFSAVAYEFAARLHKELKVPIGIIVAANSGTRIESWTSRETLEANNDRYLTVDMPFGKNSPSAMYNNMIAPLVGLKIKGFIWYQGEANRSAPGMYSKQFQALVNNWRQDWKDNGLPFYTVEIAPYTYPEDKDKAYITAFFRENQRKLSRLVTNSGIVSTVDVGSKTALHPPDKTKIGNRLAFLALSNSYQQKNSYDESTYKSVEVQGNKAIVMFANCSSLNVKGGQINDIEIAGDDQVFYPASAKIDGNKILVWSDNVQLPKSVRYCFKAFSDGNLYNHADLPIPPFRTDNWSIIPKK